MPTYEYRCPQEHHFEVFQRISDDPVAACPQCGEPGERQISGGAGFLFKGDGFYITANRSADYKKKASSESSKEGSGSAAPAKDAGKGGSSTSSTSSD